LLYGVLSHQGAYILHENMLRKLGRDVLGVFTAEDINKIDALIIPGGESTTLLKFFERLDLMNITRQRIIDGMPVLGTCAGIILLTRDVANNNQDTLGVLDISIERMGYGRQVNSFEAKIEMPVSSEKPFNGIFIRAPRIIRVGEDVEIIAKLIDDPVAVRSGKIWGTTFHPELTNDNRFHKMFIKAAEG